MYICRRRLTLSALAMNAKLQPQSSRVGLGGALAVTAKLQLDRGPEATCWMQTSPRATCVALHKGCLPCRYYTMVEAKSRVADEALQDMKLYTVMYVNTFYMGSKSNGIHTWSLDEHAVRQSRAVGFTPGH